MRVEDTYRVTFDWGATEYYDCFSKAQAVAAACEHQKCSKDEIVSVQKM